eukprot:jgi/Phyca11/505309/fgenesh2_kg.PHYCAscaffold_12_\
MSHLGIGGRREVPTLLLVLLEVLVMTIPSIKAVKVGRSPLELVVFALPLDELLPPFTGLYVESHLTLIIATEEW